MNAAMSSWNPAASRLLDGQQRAKVASVRARVIREATDGKPVCTTCGVECPNHEELSTHVAAHQQAGGAAVCAICGLCFEDWRKRMVHEQKAHNFQRYAADSYRNGAVCISKAQLLIVENVGFLFGAVQATPGRSAHPRRIEQFAPATFAEIMRKMEQTTGRKSAFTCSCHCKMPSVNARIQHEKLHEKGLLFQCSACEQIYPNAAVRNAHEARVHATSTPTCWVWE
ncbi:hypothetical protein M3Y99_00377200 [Aphelenchoides fujianensis]|nr:hypothetical protein M3Y99_00377200 [Aphelenchoides fujianensis]